MATLASFSKKSSATLNVVFFFLASNFTLPNWQCQVAGLTVAAQEYFFSIFFGKTLVTNF
jgi:hypothetical protein